MPNWICRKSGRVLELVYEGQGEPGDADFSGKGFATFDRYPLHNPVAFASEEFAVSAGIADGFVSGSMWLHVEEDLFSEFVGDLRYERGMPEADGIPEQVVGKLVGDWHPREGWQLSLSNFSAHWPDRQTPELDLVISGQFGESGLHIQSPKIDVGQWMPHVLKLSSLPEIATRILGEVSPTGQLRNVQVALPLDAPKDFNLRANLIDAAVNDWKGAPQVAHLNGYVEAGVTGGFVNIDNSGELLVHFPRIFDQPLLMDRARGQIAWQVDAETNQVLVNSGLLTMSGEVGDITGYFFLDSPVERGSRLNHLILQIGLANARVSDHRKLIPHIVPDNLEGWLDRSLIDGHVPSAGFLLQGQFGKLKPGEVRKPRSIQLAIEATDAQLEFDPKWPQLTAFSGRVEVDNGLVEGTISDGQLLNMQLHDTRLRVSREDAEEGEVLFLNGQIQGPSSDGLRILQETPVRDQLGANLDSWQLQGDMEANLQLRVPLRPGRSGHEQKVTVQLADNQLRIGNLNLAFEQAAGSLHYDRQSGLRSQSLSASLFDKPVMATIESTYNEKRQMQTVVAFQGQMDAETLALWSHRPEILFASGSSAVNGELHIRSGGVALNARSNLQGTRIDLPAPYGKVPTEQRNLVHCHRHFQWQNSLRHQL